MKELNQDMVTFTIETEPEETPIEKALSFKETGADHSAYIKEVQNDDGYNEWLWCSVTVTAKFKGLEGKNYLGQCAYRSEEDFKKGGYYEQMKEEAFDELKAKVDELLAELKD